MKEFVLNLLDRAGFYAIKGFCYLVVIIFIWIFASWIEVTAKNTTPYPEYSRWNLFEVSLEVFS